MVARTLRRFNLVDSFGLGQLVEKDRLPSRMLVARKIVESGTLLPRGISAKFLAENIVGDLRASEGDDAEADQKLLRLVAGLSRIPKGKKDAGRFHTAILNIFPLLFAQRLGAIDKEEPIFGKLKRLDLKAANDQEDGFFVNLREHYSLYCPYVFFECKNYKGDLENPEFDQLMTRLNRTSTQVGYIVCRQIEDVEKAIKHCKEPFLREDKKLMMWLTDADLIELANARVNEGVAALDSLLIQRLETVILK